MGRRNSFSKVREGRPEEFWGGTQSCPAHPKTHHPKTKKQKTPKKKKRTRRKGGPAPKSKKEMFVHFQTREKGMISGLVKGGPNEPDFDGVQEVLV